MIPETSLYGILSIFRFLPLYILLLLKTEKPALFRNDFSGLSLVRFMPFLRNPWKGRSQLNNGQLLNPKRVCRNINS